MKTLKLSLFFAAAAALAGLSFGQASAGEPSVPEGLMRAQDALSVVKGERSDAGLSEDQKKIVQLLRDMQKKALGREMTAKAAEMGIIYAIHNCIVGGGYYSPNTGMIALELKDDGRGKDVAQDLTDESVFNMMETQLLRAMYHEHVHFYQHRVWNIYSAPAGVRSYDAFLWTMASEAQAKSFEGENDIDSAFLLNRFSASVAESSFHAAHYSKRGKLSCDDGVPMLRDDFVRAYGLIPGKEENFLDGVFGDIGAIYRLFEKNDLIREIAQQAGCAVGDPLSPSSENAASPGVS